MARAFHDLGDDYRDHEHGHRSRLTEAIDRAYAADKGRPRARLPVRHGQPTGEPIMNSTPATVTIMWTETWTMSHTMTVAEAAEFANQHSEHGPVGAGPTAHEVADVLDRTDLTNALAEFDIGEIARADVVRHGINVTSTREPE